MSKQPIYSDDLLNSDDSSKKISPTLLEPTGHDINFLNRLNLCFLCVDSSNQPAFVSSAAAKFFELGSISESLSASVLLSPLLDLITHNEALKEDRSHCITLKTATGYSRSVVAFTQSLYTDDELSMLEYSIEFRVIVFFHDLSALDFVSYVLKQARLCRALYIDSMLEKDLCNLGLNKNEKEFGYSNFQQNTTIADLDYTIYKAIRILDPCTIKMLDFTIRITPSIQIDLAKTKFLPIFTKILEQACDFVGLFGRIQITDSNTYNTDMSDADNAVLIITAERRAIFADGELNPIELFVSKKCLANYFGDIFHLSNCSLSEESESTASIQAKDNEQLSEKQALNLVSYFDTVLKKTTRIANECGVSLKIEPISRELIIFNLELPTMQKHRKEN